MTVPHVAVVVPAWNGLRWIGRRLDSLRATDYPSLIIRVMEPFWFFTGLVVLLPQLESAPERPGGEGWRAPRILPAPPWTPLRASGLRARRLA